MQNCLFKHDLVRLLSHQHLLSRLVEKLLNQVVTDMRLLKKAAEQNALDHHLLHLRLVLVDH
jgi:hypothetical protein